MGRISKQSGEDLGRLIESVFESAGMGKPSFVIALTLPPDYKVVNYIANVERHEGIKILREVAEQLRAKEN